MIDIHSHILPNLDDGSKSMEMSLSIARQYIENGINKVIATPHHISGANSATKVEIQSAIEELRRELLKAKIPLEIYPGNEVFVSNSILDDINDDKIYTLNHSKYVLIELPLGNMPLYIEDQLYNLQIKGYTPIIAHPERCVDVINNPNLVKRLVELGALTQLNILSLEGFYGSKVKSTAEILLKNQLYYFVATDTHSDGHRSPNIIHNLKKLQSLTTKRYFERLTRENAQSILDNKNIIKRDIQKSKSNDTFFKKISLLFSKI